MPVLSGLEKTIPKIYRRSALNLLMFGYITGARAALQTVTIKQAIEMFKQDYGLIEGETFNQDSALSIFIQMQKELIHNFKNS